ncbi:MAG: hypothetical protein GY832_15105 [Chloroflexi bacterium]|nr:hypothetical protein [Chloroflexota bacterium]
MDKNCVATATLWFTFAYLPIVPLAYYRVQFLPHKGSGFSYQVLSRESLNGFEILKTYMFGWLICPALIFGPLVPAISEIWSVFKLPESWQILYIVFGIVWMIVAAWRLLDRHEARCDPARVQTTNSAPTSLEQ